ncbi:MAG: protein-disulfide reductase DsbD domain-containing protein [Terriglobales bacterium]
MGSSKIGLALAAVLLLSAALLAQTLDVATITVPASLHASAHSTAVAYFKIAVQPGFHIQSNHPKQEFLIPSRLSLAPADGVTVTKVAWPRAQEHTFSFSPKQPLAVFEGSFQIPVTLMTGAPGTAILHGRFRYQACNDELCRPPVTVPFSLIVHVH